MSYFATQTKHSNICDIALKRIRKYCGKKKDITEEEKQNYKAFFEGGTGTKSHRIKKKKKNIIATT